MKKHSIRVIIILIIKLCPQYPASCLSLRRPSIKCLLTWKHKQKYYLYLEFKIVIMLLNIDFVDSTVNTKTMKTKLVVKDLEAHVTALARTLTNKTANPGI